MQREIKFRAWDPSKGWMCQSQTLADFACATVTDLSKAQKQWAQLIPMQFTSLKDKNGTEIYEGDIVTGKHELFGVEDFFEACSVNWNEAQAGYTLFGYYGRPLTNFFDLEVIGNIYENQDLLLPAAEALPPITH